VIPVLTAEEMRGADRFTIDEVGLPGAVLMENAGAAVAAAIQELFPATHRPLVLCGKGNNGGDGFVVARRLRACGASVVLVGRRSDVKGDALIHLRAAERSGVAVEEVDEAGVGAVAERLAAADVVVDALLGTGLKARPTGAVGAAVEALARSADAGSAIVAIDIPSGLPSDGGAFDWPVPRARLTVTFAAPKRGLVLPPGCDVAGELRIADIGIPRDALRGTLVLVEDEDAAAAFPPREAGAHKGRFGHVLVIAGSVGKSGAATLAASGALRAGAGLVTVATPRSCLPLVATAHAELMTEPRPETSAGGLAEEGLDGLLDRARERDAVVLGPGLGRDPSTWRLVRAFAGRCPAPLVLDADALNALAPEGRDRETVSALGRRSAPTVLTPHPGEMSRLLGRPVPEVQADRPGAAEALARETGAVVVLKGQRTVVAAPDGRVAVTPAGSPALATGGTGDVLSGVVGALIARLDGWTAAVAGAHVHGRAGERAGRARGPHGVVASDVAECLPAAIGALGSSGGGAASAR